MFHGLIVRNQTLTPFAFSWHTTLTTLHCHYHYWTNLTLLTHLSPRHNSLAFLVRLGQPKYQ